MYAVRYCVCNTVCCKLFHLFHHMGGVISDEVLCCIDGTQDIRDLDLKVRFICAYETIK